MAATISTAPSTSMGGRLFPLRLAGGSKASRPSILRRIASAQPALVSAGLVVAMATVPAPAHAQDNRLVLRDVTVIDTASGAATPHRDVVIGGGRITAVVAAGKAVGGRVINARGKFVVPGFNDMHAHPLNTEGVQRLDDLTLMLANGITGFRQMSGTPGMLKERRDGTLLPFPDAPAVLAMPGEVLTPLSAPTPASAIAAVDRQKAEGADFIKVIEADRPTFDAIGAEAKKVGLPFLGHLPDRVDAVHASDIGYRSIEHLGPWTTILVSCSTDEAALRQIIANRPSRTFGGSGRGEELPPEVANRIVAEAAAAPILSSVKNNPEFFTFLRRVMDTYDEAKCRRVMDVFRRNGTWQSPTLIRVKTILFADDPASMQDPNLRYLLPTTRALWTGLASRFAGSVTAEDRATLERFWQAQRRLLRLMNETGQPLVAGTDVGGQWDIPGFSLHQDFDLLAADGFTPLKVLQMTTLNAARFLNREATMGRVQAGADADLVVLDADPTASVDSLHRIRGVVRAGHYYDRADLDRLLAETAARAGAAAKPAVPQRP